MDKSVMRERALAEARLALENYDYLSVCESLDDDGVDYTDEEAMAIHDMVMNAKVEIR
jgi:hypothetical protein